jgi:hypothetical protein
MENLATGAGFPVQDLHSVSKLGEQSHEKRAQYPDTSAPRGILIGILIGFLVMVVLSFLTGPRPNPARLLNDLNALSQAIEAFENEYEKHPNTPSLDFETEGPQAAELVTVLLGKEDPASNMQNPRQLVFLTIRVSKNRKQGGLVFSTENKAEGIYDVWGNPLRVILRPPGQSTMTIPHARKQVTTSKSAVVLSKGKDGEWGTKDDLMSADTNP